jgi:acyl carrier protein
LKLTSGACSPPTESYETVCAQVIQCVAEVLNLNAAAIRPTSVLLDLGAQSFDFVDLVFNLESRFGIEMPRAYLIPDPHAVDAFARAVQHELEAKRASGAGA